MTGDGGAPEARARVVIDQQLTQAGWSVQDRDAIDLVHPTGVAVRETIMAPGAGRADYVLYLDKKPVGVIEAKPMGTTLTEVEWQSHKYSQGLTPAQRASAVLVRDELPFIFEASGTETHFTNLYDPDPRARHIFNFPKPATLQRVIRAAEERPAAATWRGRVAGMPPFDHYDLRPASRRSVAAIEQSLIEQRYSRSLVQMATGAGKTRMAVTECYRLLKYGGFNRVLFLVDRNNLGDQTLREFRDFSTPDDGRKFTELYNVDKLTATGMVDSSKVVISTIQRVWSVLKGQAVTDEDDPNLDSYVPDAPVIVTYTPELPPEAFDLIIVDECHRSIYGLWRGVLEYFDAHVIGLTATPTKQTLGFFQQNLVAEYTYQESVADGVNVDFSVYRIKTQITDAGSTIEAGTFVPKLDRRTRQQRLEQLDEDVPYAPNELDRSVMSKDQIRLVLDTYRTKLFTEIFPGRSTVPKTLIFAKDDTHAEEIVTQVRQVFGKGNDFAAKITYTNKDAKNRLQDFRNSPTLRVAVTVDMIATGTDVKAIECVMFMRDVRSGTYFEQMKGRGARTMDDASFASLTPDAKHKDRFVIVDAVGVTEHEFVDAVPLERSATIPLKTLLEKVATFSINADEVATLASRLARLNRELSSSEQVEVGKIAGHSLASLAQAMVRANDADHLQALAEQSGKTFEQVQAEAIEQAIKPLAASPELRVRILELRASHDMIIDEVSRDVLLDAHGVVDTGKARSVVESWTQFLIDNRDEITALQLLYSRPQHAKITYAELKELADRIRRPHPTWTVDVLWDAYMALEPGKVQKSPVHTTTDLVSLVRFALKQADELVPYRSLVEERYANWLAIQQQAGATFTEQQLWWLDRIKDTIVQSAHFDIADLDKAPFTERGGTDGVLRELGQDAGELIAALNEQVAA